MNFPKAISVLDLRKEEVSIPSPLRDRTVFETGSAPSRFTFQAPLAETEVGYLYFR